jgi:hypothetical protein
MHIIVLDDYQDAVRGLDCMALLAVNPEALAWRDACNAIATRAAR